jgi:hypothetical protein
MNIATRFLKVVWVAAALLSPCYSSGQTQEQIRVAFRNIRSDDIPHNADGAAEWIYVHRNELTSELLDELYRTDRQGRDVILYALMKTKRFSPDARVCRLMVSRLNEEDNFVANSDLHLRLHWKTWTYIDARYQQFRTLIRDNLQTTDNMWTVWTTLYLLQKKGELEAIVPQLSPHVWQVIGKAMRSDDEDFNAGQAVRVCLMIGKPSLPYLREIAKSKDPQARELAQATINAMGGSRKAYGFLGATVCVDRNLFEESTGSPEWMHEEVSKAMSN